MSIKRLQPTMPSVTVRAYERTASAALAAEANVRTKTERQDPMVHKVAMETPSLPLGRSDVRFSVNENDMTMGALHISRGSVVWFPANHNYGYKISWAKFAKLMEENGRRPSEKR